MSEPLCFEMKPQLCPKCGYTLDASTKLEGDKGGPKDGDVTVCIGCASVLEFGPELKLRVIRLEDLPEDVRATLEKVVWAMGQMARRAARAEPRQ
jgi:hypothetical protein